MPGSISSIGVTQNNYSEEVIQNELRKSEEIEKTERQSPLQNPTNDPTQTALIVAQSMQTALVGPQNPIPAGNDGSVSPVEKSISQLVIEKSAPQLSTLSTQSITGATAEEDALPPEVQTRNVIE